MYRMIGFEPGPLVSKATALSSVPLSCAIDCLPVISYSLFVSVFIGPITFVATWARHQSWQQTLSVIQTHTLSLSLSFTHLITLSLSFFRSLSISVCLCVCLCVYLFPSIHFSLTYSSLFLCILQYLSVSILLPIAFFIVLFNHFPSIFLCVCTFCLFQFLNVARAHKHFFYLPSTLFLVIFLLIITSCKCPIIQTRQQQQTSPSK